MTESVLDALIGSLRDAATYNRHDLAPPAVILWTDGERLWEPVISLLLEAVPELLVLAEAADGTRRGPATWLRYRLARDEAAARPVVYLPGIGRQAFRGAAGFPEQARHLYALQFQGQFFTQQNGKDWTPAAFLGAGQGGLEFDVARDRATTGALHAQLRQVLRAPRQNLAGKKLEAADFHGLAAGDPVALMLEWIAGAAGQGSDWPPDRWAAFTALARQQFGIEPDKDGVITAVEKLVAGGGAWDAVWQRWCQSHKAFAGVRKALDLLPPPTDLFVQESDRRPATNAKREQALREQLLALGDLPYQVALGQLQTLCDEHAARADSIWAELGEADLARAAVHLKAMAGGIAGGALGHDWTALTAGYLDFGWRVDDAAWRAYAAVRDAPDLAAVEAALRGAYGPWLEQLAKQVQGWAGTYPCAGPTQASTFSPEPGTVLVFVDGLRCDLGIALAERLRGDGLDVTMDAHWTALPTVTATAKPAWRPLANVLTGVELPDGFEPQVAESGKPLSHHWFGKLIAQAGFATLDATETGDPSGCAWTETGCFDKDGHHHQAGLAHRLDDELRAVTLRVRELLAAGWQRVVVSTDHGWLLLPGGLPKVDLHQDLTESRWARCAKPKHGAAHGLPMLPWFWGGGHAVVCGPGIGVFQHGVAYAHGGLSPQEALVPVLTVSGGGPSAAPVTIGSAQWKGLRLRVQLAGAYADTALDIRTKPANASSSLLEPERRLLPPDADGKLALLVEDDAQEGAAAVLVVVRAGQIVAKRPVVIGGD
ncbi:MAG: BREX-1 system phosphatase PglZ type B [Thiohalocapsa sp.]|uniref:BREX-1 system phosphatase PglZ type B n=1 Tax=Thiohalocapsa sp. TaxID=2497641 RepID=UPI0025D8D7F0|nr:BREX-1 system phosphatase PglZ type B [Thiohalocapsa sp.]MCG6941953.1 BREX-1 system phosphatase PglZ type B [Thiohalocapsa sp.]